MGCQRLRVKKRGYCVGDLRDACTLWERDISAPQHDGAEATHNYANPLQVFCGVETMRPREIFDKSNQLLGTITHRFIIQNQGTTLSSSSTRIEFGGRYFWPLGIENLDERGEFIRLDCSELGVTTKASNR